MTVPVLQTPRLILRPIEERDAEGLHQAYGNADAMRYWDLVPSANVSQTAERIRGSIDVDPRWHGMWAMVTPTGDFAGAVNYHARQPGQRRLAVGWMTVPAFWRQGLATEAVRAVLAHCFTTLDTHRVEARIEPENVASRRLATRLGFTEEGLLRDWLRVDGQLRSVLMYSLLQPEWRA